MLRKYVEKLIEKNGIERQSIVAMEECSDELESIISKGDCVSHYEKEIQILEKALDKACELITEAVSQDCTIFDEVTLDNVYYIVEEGELKEWLKKDV